MIQLPKSLKNLRVIDRWVLSGNCCYGSNKGTINKWYALSLSNGILDWFPEKDSVYRIRFHDREVLDYMLKDIPLVTKLPSRYKLGKRSDSHTNLDHDYYGTVAYGGVHQVVIYELPLQATVLKGFLYALTKIY